MCGVTFKASHNSVYVMQVSGLDRDAFETLYAAVGPRLWRAILAYTGGRVQLTDEAVAEAFARVLERLETVRDPAAYVYRVAFRLASHEMRQPAPGSMPPEVAVWDDPGLAELFDVLRHLSGPERSALYLHYQADLPVREVAKLMGTSEGAVRVRLFRGRRRLAALLGGERDA
jgi:RNA polymerase sigma-70 factor (ECF subfamily)